MRSARSGCGNGCATRSAPTERGSAPRLARKEGHPDAAPCDSDLPRRRPERRRRARRQRRRRAHRQRRVRRRPLRGGRSTPSRRAILAGDLPPEALAITFNNRGVAYSELGDFDRAISDYNQALTLAPGDAHRDQEPADRAPAPRRRRGPARRSGSGPGRLRPGDRTRSDPSAGLPAPRPAGAGARRPGGGDRRPDQGARPRPGECRHCGAAGRCGARGARAFDQRGSRDGPCPRASAEP